MLTANMSELNNCLFTPSTNTVSVSNTVHTFLTQVYITGIINPDCVNSKDGFRYLKDILH